ncbi:MAG: acetolactate decarboxylase [Chloroflexi bacterium]|nr:acetolactate decarboxylase [Chloroflexota bacterium]MBL7061798.1 acetolactate decarboxylase [Dehalococcoidia bacterium]
MKRVYLLLAATLVIITICTSGCLSSPKDRDVLFQSSTISALSEGVFDGDLTYKDLRQHGDFGLGTFDDLDGEMIALAGEFYQIKADGKAYLVEDSMETPFAVVTLFEPDKAVSLDKVLDYEQLKQYLDSMLPTNDIFYAIKAEGAFKYIKARSVPTQSKPYPSLAEALEGQTIFEFHDVTGSLVGFWCPSYVEGINVPGYHFHFITSDRKAGGHLLDCRTESAKIEIDYTSEFFMMLLGD